MDIIHDFNSNMLLAVEFLDFSLAFDTVDNDILLQFINDNLFHLGFREVMKHWLASYLHDGN